MLVRGTEITRDTPPGHFNAIFLQDVDPLDTKELALIFEMLLACSRSDAQIELAIANQEISGIANHTYSLCQQLNHYYHLFPIIAEKDLKLKSIRLSLIALVKKNLENLLHIMGIPVPERM